MRNNQFVAVFACYLIILIRVSEREIVLTLQMCYCQKGLSSNREQLVPAGCKQMKILIMTSELKLAICGILHYLWSADLSKSFSLLMASIFISKNFFNRFCPVEKCGATPRCVYLDSLPYASQIHLKAIDKYFHLRLVFSSPTVSFVYLEDIKKVN